ncbi:hypothetical protein QBC34DRAFT_380503 [Podospora aff. communis PSN243]|uniref:VPS37 C-terminal domain-containing protein n=1 Tax=Podospora aff. communis PSN243 TaxID=3040156 RepID=A0AAV9GLC0_9PEZI|nr:hypothetical protein QBC34DRAFT_380503 [Podospora aff. communis PSN243]
MRRTLDQTSREPASLDAAAHILAAIRQNRAAASSSASATTRAVSSSPAESPSSAAFTLRPASSSNAASTSRAASYPTAGPTSRAASPSTAASTSRAAMTSRDASTQVPSPTSTAANIGTSLLPALRPPGQHTPPRHYLPVPPHLPGPSPLPSPERGPSPQHLPFGNGDAFNNVTPPAPQAPPNAASTAEDTADDLIEEAYRPLSPVLQQGIAHLRFLGSDPTHHSDPTFGDACELHRRMLDAEMQRDLAVAEAREAELLDAAYLRLEEPIRRMERELAEARENAEWLREMNGVVTSRREGVVRSQGVWWRGAVMEGDLQRRVAYLEFVAYIRGEFLEERREIRERYQRAKEVLKGLMGDMAWDSERTVDEEVGD